MVTIAVFVAVSAVSVAGFVAGREHNELDQAVTVVISLVRDAQTRALSGAERPPCPACDPIVPRGGYGVQFALKESTAQLFADGNASGDADVPSEIVATRALGSGRVIVTALKPLAADGARASASFPPGGARGLILGGSDYASLRVTLTHAASGVKKIVVINRISGIAEIEN